MRKPFEEGLCTGDIVMGWYFFGAKQYTCDMKKGKSDMYKDCISVYLGRRHKW